jgi:hypothetical protein
MVGLLRIAEELTLGNSRHQPSAFSFQLSAFSFWLIADG